MCTLFFFEINASFKKSWHARRVHLCWNIKKVLPCFNQSISKQHTLLETHLPQKHEIHKIKVFFAQTNSAKWLSGASCWQNSVAPCACAHRQRPCPSFTRTASRWQHSPSERWAQGCQWSCRPGFLRWWFYAVEDFNVKMFEKCVKSTCSFTIVEIKLWCQQFD